MICRLIAKSVTRFISLLCRTKAASLTKSHLRCKWVAPIVRVYFLASVVIIQVDWCRYCRRATFSWCNTTFNIRKTMSTIEYVVCAWRCEAARPDYARPKTLSSIKQQHAGYIVFRCRRIVHYTVRTNNGFQSAQTTIKPRGCRFSTYCGTSSLWIGNQPHHRWHRLPAINLIPLTLCVPTRTLRPMAIVVSPAGILLFVQRQLSICWNPLRY